MCVFQVKLRCRKGIPSSLRAKAWQLLSNSKELLDSNPGKFEVLPLTHALSVFILTLPLCKTCLL